MNPIRKAAIAAAVVASTLTGGAIGTALFAGSAATAATTSTTAPASSSASPSATSPGASATTPGASSAAPAVGLPTGPGGTFKSNEDVTHEAGESAAREAQENAGQFPTVP